MRLSVRVFNLLKLSLTSGFIAILFFFAIQPTVALAQTTLSTTPTTAPSRINSYLAPNTDANVPQNQHTLVQSLVIEVLSTVVCQLSGVDLTNPDMPCLGINPETQKIGYVTPSDNKNAPQGAIGMMAGMIGGLYTPAISSVDYVNHMAYNFGIAKPAYADEPGYGFTGLTPVLKIWTVIRNIAYLLLILAFIFIGLGIMLRVKIDPRTVMTIQNQIPRIIICILLITFSYAIAGLMIDAMWVTTYAGINALTSANDVEVAAKKDGENCNAGGTKLSESATRFLLQTPITYFNQVFSQCQDEGTDVDGGIVAITQDVSGAVGSLAKSVVDSLLLDDNESCGLTALDVCLKMAVSSVVQGVAVILVFLVVLITIIIALFRTWYNLVKAYIFTLIYIIMGPFWIVFGLLPNKPLGVGVWLRSLFANLALFPATAFLFVGARILKDLYDTPLASAASVGVAQAAPEKFIPPLTGHPLASDFGALLAFGALLTAPALQGILREKMKIPNVGSGKIVAAGLVAGAAAPKAFGGAVWKRTTRKENAAYNQEEGILRSMLAGKQGTRRYKFVKTILGDKYRPEIKSKES